MLPSDLVKQSKRIVIKIGSAILVDQDAGSVRDAWLKEFTLDVSRLIEQGKEVAIVSSGAIALGRFSVGVSNAVRPSSIPLDKKQAAAAIGQVMLSEAYDKGFKAYDLQTALVLLTPKDTEVRQSHLNARATLQTLLEHKKIPVINENDTVSTDEIRFGDNDRLAARVAQMIEADLLIQLSTTDGLYTDNPDENNMAEHIPVVEKITPDMNAMAKDTAAGISTGGMKSKIMAADIATKAGVHMVIAKGVNGHSISTMISGESLSTVFLAQERHTDPRKRWLAGHLQVAGSIIIDDGALSALKEGKSLLPAGVVGVNGDFQYGDVVDILDLDNNKIAIGLASYSALETKAIAGHPSDGIDRILGYARNKSAVHRSNMALC